jgi:hypothetical protein
VQAVRAEAVVAIFGVGNFGRSHRRKKKIASGVKRGFP